MSQGDVERVRADLAVMQGVCTEPSLPREDVVVGLVVAAFGLAIAGTAFFVPTWSIKLLFAVFGVVGLGVYVPWKRRLLVQKGATRLLERRELAISMIVMLPLVAFFLFHRFVIPGPNGYGLDQWRYDAAAAMFFVGVGVLANALVHPSRRPYLAWAAALAIGGLLYPLTTTTAAGYALVGAVFAVGGLGGSAWLAYLIRRQHGHH